MTAAGPLAKISCRLPSFDAATTSSIESFRSETFTPDVYKRQGLATTRIYVQDKYTRAAHGGTGYAKVGGNYGGGMRASQDAMKYNCCLLYTSRCV